MKIDHQLNASALTPALQKFWQLSGDKLNLTHRDYDPARGAPVFTVAGKYTARGWTEWTEGFFSTALISCNLMPLVTTPTRPEPNAIP